MPSNQSMHKRRWEQLFAKRRNWLMLWRMRGMKMDVRELARRCECSHEKIRDLINHPGKVPSAELMKLVCESLQANPCELGWTRRDMTITPFFMVDVTAFIRMLDVMLSGFVHISETLIAMRKKVDMVQQDYMDRMADDTMTDSEAEDYLESGEELKEVIAHDHDSEEW